MKIAIVEDNLKWMDRISDSINNFFQDDAVEIEIDKYQDAESFLNVKKEYEIVCMDVELKNQNGEKADGMDGIEALQHYKKVFPDCLAAIVTVHEDWSRKGYLAGVYRYIYKRNLKEEIQEMLQSAMPYLRMNRKMRFYVVGKENLEAVYKDVIYIETDKRNVKIHTTKGNYINNKTIGDWEEELGEEGFYRLQKSYLVNLKWVDQIETKKALLYNGERIPISSKKKDELWTKLLEWRLGRKSE